MMCRTVGGSEMATKQQEVATSQHDAKAEAVEPTDDGAGMHTKRKRPIWKTIAAIGDQIPEETWGTVPDDGSINYKLRRSCQLR